MTEHEAVYGFLTGRQFVELNAALQGVADAHAAVDRAIALVDMAEAQDRSLGGAGRRRDEREPSRIAVRLLRLSRRVLLDCVPGTCVITSYSIHYTKLYEPSPIRPENT